MGSNAVGPVTEINRSINYMFPVPVLVAFSNVIVAAPNLAAGVTVPAGILAANPDALKVAGNTLYFTDIFGGVPATDRIVTYNDPLAVVTVIPVITAPADNYLVQVNGQTGVVTPVTVVFTGASLATNHAVEIARDAAFTQPLTGAGAAIGLFTTNFTVPTLAGTPALIPGQTYYYRIRANAPLFSNYSVVRTFKVQPFIAAVPGLTSPQNGALLQTQSPAFSWTPIASTTKYSFQLSTTPSFATSTYADTPPTAGALLPVTIKLEMGKQYFWRVKALEPIEGDWSTVANFMIAEEAPAPEPPVVIQQLPAPVINIPAPQPAPIINIPPAPEVKEIAPAYIWAIIIIGAVLVIAVIVLIVRTRRTV
jgi:hypothetical protein